MNLDFLIAMVMACGALGLWMLVISLVLDFAGDLLQGVVMRWRARQLLREMYLDDQHKTWRSSTNP